MLGMNVVSEKSEDPFLASFEKPDSLGDVLNKVNAKTVTAFK
jgi:hypothetical protein